MPDPRYVATVAANGQFFTGFKSLMVQRTYGTTTSIFSFTCSDAAGEAAQLKPGPACTITLGGKQVFSGNITTRGVSYDAESHDVVISGKSLTAPVSLSSMPVQPGNMDGYGAEQIIRGALAPHGIALNVVNPPPNWSKPFSYFAVNPGERVIDHIERALRMRGAFVWDDAQGRLCVGGSQNGAPVADLVEGVNILRCVGKLDNQSVVNLWNTYGQQPGVGDDPSTRNAQGQVTDPQGRPGTQVVEHMPQAGDSEDAATYAGRIAAQAGWDTVDIDVTVAGWFRPDGNLWDTADNVTIYSPMALPGVGKLTMGVQEVTYSQVQTDQGEGTTTTLKLVLAKYLVAVGHAEVQSDPSGNIVSNPGQPQAVPPDTSGGSPSPQGGPKP